MPSRLGKIQPRNFSLAITASKTDLNWSVYSATAGFLISTVFLTRSLAAQSIDPLQFLPRGASATTLVSDAAGNLYAGGVLDNHGFVAKLPAGDSEIRVLYRLTGTGFDSVAAIALGPDGAIFVTGTTNSSDFPATTTVNSRPSENDPRAFVLKLDQDGKLQFATLIGGSSSYGKAVVVNGNGGVGERSTR